MQWKMTAKLVAAFAFVAVVASLAGLVQMGALQAIEQEYRIVTDQLDPASMAAVEVEAAIGQKTSALWGYVLFRNRDQVAEFEAADMQSKSALLALGKWTDQANWQKLVEVNDQFSILGDEAMRLIAAGESEAAITLLSQKAAPLQAEIAPLVKAIRMDVTISADKAKKEVAARVDQTRWVGTAAMGAALLLALGLGVYLARGIVKPIRRTATAVQRLAEGDLTVEELTVRGKDELADLARSFNQMVQNLRGLAQGVNRSTEAVLKASELLAAAVEQSGRGAGLASEVVGQVATGADHQAEAAGEMRVTMHELKGTIAQISEGAERTAAEVEGVSLLLSRMMKSLEGMVAQAAEVSQAASLTAGTAQEGAAAAQRASSGMGRVQSAVGQAADRITELERLSAQIGEITGVISGIAGQTSLLALNAAIEAARAGEAGRGFGVVADAVRQLAEQSAGSAKEIADLIGRIQTCTGDAVKAMQKGTAEVESGSRMTSEAGVVLQQIVGIAGETASEMNQIASASQEVRRGAEQVVKAFEAVAEVAVENSASTEEMAAGAEQVASATERVAAVSDQNRAAAGAVSSAVTDLTASTRQVAEASRSLTDIARELKTQVARFKL